VPASVKLDKQKTGTRVTVSRANELCEDANLRLGMRTVLRHLATGEVCDDLLRLISTDMFIASFSSPFTIRRVC
jgi:hypothetical protein